MHAILYNYKLHVPNNADLGLSQKVYGPIILEATVRVCVHQGVPYAEPSLQHEEKHFLRGAYPQCFVPLYHNWLEIQLTANVLEPLCIQSGDPERHELRVVHPFPSARFACFSGWLEYSAKCRLISNKLL